MKLNLIALSAAAALIAGAAQAQDAATATVNLQAVVGSKCFFGGSGDGASASRTIDFGDITEVVGFTSDISLSGITGGVLKLACTTPISGGVLSFASRDGGYLTPAAASASSLNDNQKVLYQMSYQVLDSSSGGVLTRAGNVGADIRSDGQRVSHELSGGGLGALTNVDVNITSAVLGGKNADGSYKYLAGSYSDVVTVTFTPSS